MTLPDRMKFGIFLAPFHPVGENPTLGLERDLELVQWLDYLGYDEAWIGEHHSAGWETIDSPEIFIAVAAERTKYIKLGTGVVSLPYHHPFMVASRMVMLDHLTRGRVMMGVGPGALAGDAYMLGINTVTSRRRMDEALGIILRLMTEEEPITYEAEWFTLKEAVLHLRPYTRPHLPVFSAAVVSPAGMELAGKYGAGVLTLHVPRGEDRAYILKDFWKIAEERAKAHGKSVSRDNWRVVLHVHLAETRQEALDQARVGAGLYQRGYLEGVLGQPAVTDGPAEEIVDHMMATDQWCVGTPEDLIARIERLDEVTGGFGGSLVLTNDWATREQNLRSYELLARYVMPHFQGSLSSLSRSETWSARMQETFAAQRRRDTERADQDYATRTQAP